MKEIAYVYHFSYNCSPCKFLQGDCMRFVSKNIAFPILAVKILVLLTRTQERRHAYAL